jgi:Holliday junction resolvasome RuvABC endonuclease subunit
MLKGNTVRILSFDPGLTNLGWGFSEYTLGEPSHLKVIDYGRIEAIRQAKKRRPDSKEFPPGVITLKEVYLGTKHLHTKFDPDYVVTEDTFYNPRRPNAYRALLLCISSIENFLYDAWIELDRPMPVYDKFKLRKYAPKFIKSIFAENGGASKQQMIDTLQLHDIVFPKTKYIDGQLEIIEHEADAIAAAYTLVSTELSKLI